MIDFLGNSYPLPLLMSTEQWHVYKAIEQLPHSLLLATEHGRRVYELLVHTTICVLQDWAQKWAGLPEWQSFLNRRLVFPFSQTHHIYV